MKFSQLLNSELVIPDLRAHNHESAINELIDCLISHGKLCSSLRHEIILSLKEREELVSTGIGHGVAIPHTFSNAIHDVIATFGRSINGFDYQALDNKPVHHVILFIVPATNHSLHLPVLASIAKRFTNPQLREWISNAKSREEILDLLSPKSSRKSKENSLGCGKP